MKEEWKDVVGFEGLYQVSNLGRVKSVGRMSYNFVRWVDEIILATNDDERYYSCQLRKDGKNHSKRVHQIVAIAWIPNPNNLPQVNHIDSNKKNNHITNLEWCSNRENITHGKTNDIDRKKTSKYTGVSWNAKQSKWISQIKLNNKLFKLGSFDDEELARNAYIEFFNKNNIQNKYLKK